MTGLGTMDSVSRRGVATGQPYSSVSRAITLLTTYGTEYGVHLLASALVIHRSSLECRCSHLQILIGLLWSGIIPGLKRLSDVTTLIHLRVMSSASFFRSKGEGIKQ